MQIGDLLTTGRVRDYAQLRPSATTPNCAQLRHPICDDGQHLDLVFCNQQFSYFLRMAVIGTGKMQIINAGGK